MEDRDVRASPHQDQSSLSAPHAATLPSMHAPHHPNTQQQQQQHHQQHQHSQSYSPSSQTTQQYAASHSQHPHHHQQQQHRHYYDQRDGASGHTQYEYSRQPSAPVALPPIQHLDASNMNTNTNNTNNHDSNSSSSNTNNTRTAISHNTADNNMSRQPTLPPPPPPPLAPQHASHSAHSYPSQSNTTNGDTRHHYEQHHAPSAYAPQYAPPNQYQPYASSNLHHHQQHQQPPPPPQTLPPSAMMPSNVHNGHAHASGLRFGLPPTLQLDPRQMSGGRHKKEIKRRTKTGCLTCRKRRIKCDERHPHCRNCEKSKRECLGYDPVFKSQPAPPTLQPAPLPNQMSKSEPYRYAYHNPENMYAARPGPPPQPSATTALHAQAAPLTVNGGYNDHNAGPLADGDHNRGQTHAHGTLTDLSSKR